MKISVEERLDIRKYLIYLEEDGWSEMIDSRWKEEVRETLSARFPNMTDDEWCLISDVVFW